MSWKSPCRGNSVNRPHHNGLKESLNGLRSGTSTCSSPIITGNHRDSQLVQRTIGLPTDLKAIRLRACRCRPVANSEYRTRIGHEEGECWVEAID